MEFFALKGLWLFAGLAIVYVVGVMTAQWAKDKVNGVPVTLRNALNATEAAAVKEMKAAHDQVVVKTASLLAPAKAVVEPAATPVATPDPAAPATA